MFQTGLIGLVGSLGSVSKIVLLLLFIFSVISWAIIFFKWRVFRMADREDKRFLALLVKTRDLDELYRLQWGARGSGEQYKTTVKKEFEPTLERLKNDAKKGAWIRPEVVYGYFPAQSQGNDVIIYDPAAYASDGGSLREIARFHFPRMVGRERLCLADYVRSVDSGDVDVLPLQIVTVGAEATTAKRAAIRLAMWKPASPMPITGAFAIARAASRPVSSKQAMMPASASGAFRKAWIRPGTAKASS